MRKIKITVDVPIGHCLRPDRPGDGEMGFTRCQGLKGCDNYCYYFSTELKQKYINELWIYQCSECKGQTEVK